jgi:hypothetical protein
MNSGTITGNTSSYGGGVSVDDSGIFTMIGGTISGNYVHCMSGAMGMATTEPSSWTAEPSAEIPRM